VKNSCYNKQQRKLLLHVIANISEILKIHNNKKLERNFKFMKYWKVEIKPN